MIAAPLLFFRLISYNNVWIGFICFSYTCMLLSQVAIRADVTYAQLANGATSEVVVSSFTRAWVYVYSLCDSGAHESLFNKRHEPVFCYGCL